MSTPPFSSFPHPAQPPGLNVGDNVAFDSLFKGRLGGDTTLRVPIEVVDARGQTKHVTLSFSGTRKSLEAFKNDSRFANTVKRIASAAIRSQALLRNTPSEENSLGKPITFQATNITTLEDFTKTQEQAFENFTAPLGDPKNVKSAIQHLLKNIPLATATAYEEENLKKGLDFTYSGLSQEMQTTVEQVFKHALASAAKKTSLEFRKTHGFGAWLTTSKEEILKQKVLLELHSYQLLDDDSKAALDAHDKEQGNFYSKYALEGAPNLSKVGANLQQDIGVLNKNAKDLGAKETALQGTLNKNEQYVKNLFLLADQYHAQAVACRNLANILSFHSDSTNANHFQAQAASAAASASNLRAGAEQQLAILRNTAKIKALSDGAPPYLTPKTPDEALLNAEVLLDPNYAVDLNKQLTAINFDYAAIQQLSSPSPSANAPKPTLQPKELQELKAKADAYQKELEGTLKALSEQSPFASAKEKIDIRQQITAVRKKLIDVTTASLQLDTLIQYLQAASKPALIYTQDAVIKNAKSYLESMEQTPTFKSSTITSSSSPSLQEIDHHTGTLTQDIANAAKVPTLTEEQRCAVAAEYKTLMDRLGQLIDAANPLNSTLAPNNNKQKEVYNKRLALNQQKEELDKKYKALLSTISDPHLSVSSAPTSSSPTAAAGSGGQAAPQIDFQEWGKARQAAINQLPSKTEAERARKAFLTVELALHADPNTMPVLPHSPSSLSSIPEERDLQLRDQVAHLKALFDFKTLLQPPVTLTLGPITTKQNITIDKNFIFFMDTVKNTLLPQGSPLPPSTQHTANLNALAAIYDDASKNIAFIQSRADLEGSRNQLAAASRSSPATPQQPQQAQQPAPTAAATAAAGGGGEEAQKKPQQHAKKPEGSTTASSSSSSQTSSSSLGKERELAQDAQNSNESSSDSDDDNDS